MTDGVHGQVAFLDILKTKKLSKMFVIHFYFSLFQEITFSFFILYCAYLIVPLPCLCVRFLLMAGKKLDIYEQENFVYHMCTAGCVC